ncbi:MAG: hypothetical protein WBO58_19895 [Gammaproteobacteria bacterium]
MYRDICHKPDVVPDLLAVRSSEPDVYPYLFASKFSGSQNSRHWIWMASFQGIVTQTGSENNPLQMIDISPCQRVPVDCGRALMAALNRTASID